MPDHEFTWQGFAKHLNVEHVADGHYVGRCLPGRGNRPFGGHLVAQAVQLVQETSPSALVPMSVQAHFLAAGDSREPMDYRVASIRSGRSFEHWSVDVVQDGRALVTATVVLHQPESSPVHQVQPRHPAKPDDLPVITLSPREGTRVMIRSGLDIRQGPRWVSADDGSVPYQSAWYRCVDPSALGHEYAVVAWCSDLELAWTVDLPYREQVRSRVAASLDHAIHFHRAFDPRDWFLFEQESPALNLGRGLVTGRMFTAAGELIASVTQQTLLRLEFED